MKIFIIFVIYMISQELNNISKKYLILINKKDSIYFHLIAKL